MDFCHPQSMCAWFSSKPIWCKGKRHQNRQNVLLKEWKKQDCSCHKWGHGYISIAWWLSLDVRLSQQRSLWLLTGHLWKGMMASVQQIDLCLCLFMLILCIISLSFSLFFNWYRFQCVTSYKPNYTSPFSSHGYICTGGCDAYQTEWAQGFKDVYSSSRCQWRAHTFCAEGAIESFWWFSEFVCAC